MSRRINTMTREQKLSFATKYAKRVGVIDAPAVPVTEAAIELARAFLQGAIHTLVASANPTGLDQDVDEEANALYKEILRLSQDISIARSYARDLFGNDLMNGDPVAVPLAFTNADGSVDAELAPAKIESIFLESSYNRKLRVKAFVSFTDDRGGQAPALHEVYLDETALRALPRAGRGQVTIMPIQSTIEPEIAVRNAYIEGAKAMLAIERGSDSSQPIVIGAAGYTSARTAVLSAIEARSADGIVYHPVQIDAEVLLDDGGHLIGVSLDRTVILPDRGLVTAVVSATGTFHLHAVEEEPFVDAVKTALDVLIEVQGATWFTETIVIALP